MLYGSCFTNNCTLTPEDQTALTDLESNCINDFSDGESCAQLASNDPDLLSALQNFTTQTCEDLSEVRCGEFALTDACGCATPSNLGAACTTDAGCDGGDLSGGCIPALDPDGNPTAFPGGYCVADPCREIPNRTPPYTYASSACGAGNLCRVVDNAGQAATFCIAGCDSCVRTGYACQVLALEQNQVGDVVFLEGCFPGCTSDAGCAPGDRCNVGSGVCEVQCSTTPIGGTAGNPSLADVCVDTGGVCQGGFCTL